MKKQDQINLQKLLKKVSNFKPKNAPKKPQHQPNKKELEEVYIFDGDKIITS